MASSILPKKFRFSAAALGRIPTPPAGKRDYRYDEAEAALTLQTTSTGSQSFQVYQRTLAGPVRVTLGHYDNTLADKVVLPEWVTTPEKATEYAAGRPALNIRRARALAKLIKASLADPQASGVASKKKEISGEPTLSKVLDNYRIYLVAHKRPKTVQNFDTFRSPLSVFEGQRVSRIDPDEVMRWHARMGRELGPYRSNRAIELGRAAVARAPKDGLLSRRVLNPFAGLTKHKEAKRTRRIMDDELEDFRNILAGTPQPWRDAITLTLLTGCRAGDVQAMQWSDIDLQGGVWTLQADDSKSGNVVERPLVGIALDILKRRQDERTDDTWVFPAGSASGRMETLSNAFPKFLGKPLAERHPGRSRLSVHDLRRSTATWLRSGGASTLVVQNVLGHKLQGALSHYALADVEAARAAIEAIVVPKLMGEAPAANVVRLADHG